MAIRKRTGPLRQMQRDVSALTDDARNLTASVDDKLGAVDDEHIREMMYEARAILRKLGKIVDAADRFVEGIDGDGVDDYKVVTWVKQALGSVTMVWPLITKYILRR